MDAPISRKSVPVIYSHTGLRGIAAMTVVLGHLSDFGITFGLNRTLYYNLFYGGGIAVDIFFILSGFIMNWVYVAYSDSINWKSFFLARVARLFPLYYLTTIIYLPIPLYSMLKHGLLYVGADYGTTLIMNALLVSGIVDGYHQTINGPAWSIHVELFCYLFVFPLLVLFGRRLKSSRFNLAVSLLIVGFLTLLFGAIPKQGDGTFALSATMQADYTFLAHGLIGFTLGFYLCSIYQNSLRTKPSVVYINVFPFLSIAVFYLTRFSLLPSEFMWYSLPVIVFFTAFDQGLLSGILKTNLLQWVGERAYSLYLWHLPMILCYLFIANTFYYHRELYAPQLGLVNFLVAIIFILITTDLSYRYIEGPCRRLIRNLG